MLWNGTCLVAQMVKKLPAMPETQVQSLGRKDALEKEMTAHFSILAWRIPWTAEPGGYSPWGHRVGHDWATNTFTMLWNIKDKLEKKSKKGNIVVDRHAVRIHFSLVSMFSYGETNLALCEAWWPSHGMSMNNFLHLDTFLVRATYSLALSQAPG